IAITIVCVLVADLVTKHFLFSVEYFNLIPGVISIASNGGNTGAAWGMFSGKTLMLVIVSVIMIIALFLFNYFIKKKNTFYCLSFGFIIGGALGNLVDRVALQYVRDFIFLDFWPSFPIFNMADSFLCVGAVMMAIFILFMTGEKNEK
ncbi:MAG: signal peptidase II, partial [Clostridia bacterium]|nr:signal peptidase II [Clostridia bacterium]